MSKRIYKARVGAPFKQEDAQKIGETIEKIPVKTPENILEQARDKKCIIHRYIEWNNKIASEKFRLYQVKNIVSHIVIEIKEVENKPPLRAFYSVKAEDSKTLEYVNLETTFSEDYYRKQIIARAYTELQNWIGRYRQYEELKKIIDVLDNIGFGEEQIGKEIQQETIAKESPIAVH